MHPPARTPSTIGVPMSDHQDDLQPVFEIDGEFFTLHPDLVRLAQMGAFDEELAALGELPEPTGTFQRFWPKTRRNDPCPCGSGKKYKKCCRLDEVRG